jgi:phosphoribosylaminoimidazole carboxylase PurK protein
VKYDLGFLGGGQLARMSIQAAQRMGLKCLSLDPGEDTPASQIADNIVGSLDDSERISEVLTRCDFVTLENEFIPAEAIREALAHSGANAAKLTPCVETLATIQDKLLQRHALTQAGVPAPKAVSLDDGGSKAIAEIGFPMVLKVRFGGYDGKGTRYAHTEEELHGYADLWHGKNWLAEQFIPFKRELAAMAYVSEWGAGCFPTMETVQTNHVCDLVYPSGIDASEVALAAVEAVGGNGLFGVEMFELEDGSVLINELAPRPHNTGHYTLDWGSVSQFEQHVRLAMGFPLTKPMPVLPVCMANMLGPSSESLDLQKAINSALIDPRVRVHWYGKAEMRKGRKMGHLNVVGRPGENIKALVDLACEARERFFANG